MLIYLTRMFEIFVADSPYVHVHVADHVTLSISYIARETR